MSPALADTLSGAFSQPPVEGTRLPESFWALRTSANLSALDKKARPVACEDVLRRINSRTFCRQYGRAIAERLQALGRYGVAVPGGASRSNGVTSYIGVPAGLRHPDVRRQERFRCWYATLSKATPPPLHDVVVKEL